MAKKKTESEILFERYLVSQNLIFECEENIEERSRNSLRTPDYTIKYKSTQLIFEVKEFDYKEDIPGHIGCSTIEETLRPIREKIKDSAGQFRDFKSFSCSLVLYSFDPFISNDMQNPGMVYGVMYGDVGWTYPYDVSTDSFLKSDGLNHFLNNGKMLSYGSGNTRNTTMSDMGLQGTR